MKKVKLPKTIEAFLKPDFYPHSVKRIKLIQTHISYVVLTGDYVYKIKKPVNFGFVDYTTLEKRKEFCEREIELNRRLAPEIYLGVAPICDYNGKPNLDNMGVVMEYAVKMRQLPVDKMMSAFLRKNKVKKIIIKKIAEKLADFHRRAATNQKISDYGSLNVIRKNCFENLEFTQKYIGRTILAKDYREIKSWTENFIARKKDLFEKRIKSGKIRDCHGDLQSDHICLLGDKILIYDCIEFNERFRYGDVASEIAFLAMDLDFHGYPELSVYLVRRYAEITKDSDLLKLINFYKCYRAYVRGKVGSFKFDDPYISRKEKREAKKSAKKYFKLAHSYICLKPFLLIVAGLSGTGKTTIAKILAQKTGFHHISSDIVRKELAKTPLFEHRPEEFGKGIYSAEFSRMTYEKMLRQAEDFLKKGKSVIIDATFKKREERQRTKSLAEKIGARLLLIECRVFDKVIRERMKKRAKEKAISDADWKIYLKQKKDFEAIKEIPKKNHLIIHTSGTKDEKIVQDILRRTNTLDNI